MKSNEVTRRGSQRKKFSRAEVNAVNKKSAPKPEEVFISQIDIETPEEKAMRERLRKRALEEAKLRAEALNHKFIVGKKYFIGEEGKFKPLYQADFTFIYEGKQGKHHVFRHFKGNWSRTYTDPQLIGKFIKEVEE